VDFWEDYEVLKVETPELLELRLPLAGIGPRFLAALVDYLILMLTTGLLVVVAIAVISIGAIPSSSGNPGVLAIIIGVAFGLLAILIWVGYFAVIEWSWNGQTIGKRLTGIRVIKRNGTSITFRDAFIRALMRLVDWLPANGLVALVSFFATKNQQRLGDLVADTVVVREFRSRLPLNWTGGALPASSGKGELSPQLLHAIGSYLSRCAALSTATREELSRACIRALGYDSGAMSLGDQEHYLASIASGAFGAGRV
jgi:uncharacterized RDD family membrane protein YckC